MAENKTRATVASVDEYIAARAGNGQEADCRALMAMFGRVTKQEPKMWGPSIVGYGSYRYTYESGRTGEICLTGFAIRGRKIVVYVDVGGEEQQARLAALGKHETGKSCLYFRRLADLDEAVLEQLVEGSIAELKRRYPGSGAE
jgi:hypothetical protein